MTIDTFLDPDEKIRIHFWRNKNYLNIGDETNKYLIEKLSNKKTIKVKGFNENFIVGIGSVLHHQFGSKACFWGSGLISEGVNFRGEGNIIGVRGPLTRKLLFKRNIKKPVLGDPALLLPIVFEKKSIKAEFDVGIIPHAEDYDYLKKILETTEKKPNMLIIDVRTDDVEKFVSQILQCKCILSSSLHGLIIPHAYNKPALWIRLSDKIIGKNFKFFDYFLSVGIYPYQGLTMEQFSLFQLIKICLNRIELNSIQNFDMKPLINNCPFLTNTQKEKFYTRLV